MDNINVRGLRVTKHINNVQGTLFIEHDRILLVGVNNCKKVHIHFSIIDEYYEDELKSYTKMEIETDNLFPVSFTHFPKQEFKIPFIDENYNIDFNLFTQTIRYRPNRLVWIWDFNNVQQFYNKIISYFTLKNNYLSFKCEDNSNKITEDVIMLPTFNKEMLIRIFGNPDIVKVNVNYLFGSKKITLIFIGHSGLGKSFLSGYLNFDSLYETDESTNLNNNLDVDIIVIGNRKKAFTINNLLQRVKLTDRTCLLCEFVYL